MAVPYEHPRPVAVDRGRGIDPRTGRARLGVGQLVALGIGALFATLSIAVCAVLCLLLAFAADGCSAGTSREANDTCMAAMGTGVAIAYGSFAVLFLVGLGLVCITRLRPLIRIGGLYVIGVLAPIAMAIAWLVTDAGQPH